MWKRIIILILLVLFLLYGNATLSSNVYLPKADLIKGTGPEVYLLENGVRHWIPNPATFEHFRYKWANIKTIADEILESYPQRDDLNRYDDYPDGALLKGTGPEVYLIELGKRRWIPSPEIFVGNDFGWKYIIDVDDRTLERIDQGDNLTLREPNRYPETIILEGADQTTALETSEVTFKYSGTNPLGQTSDLSFETYLKGHDTRWRNQGSSYTETYRLSEETKSYTFYVRAKNSQGYVDPSPASWTFRIGVSPYYNKVEIRNIHADEDDFENDYLILRNKARETINITGWTIDAKRTTITVPRAAKKLRYSFSSSNNADINLAYRGEVIISTGLSPQGVNFRTNKCTGYLDQSSKFSPSLDEDCPYLNDSEYSHLKKTCRDFIDDLSRCELPDYSDDWSVKADSQCTNFLNDNLAYNQCYLDYYREADFFQDEWRVFLGKTIDILDNDEDTLVLRDANGFLIDESSY